MTRRISETNLDRSDPLTQLKRLVAEGEGVQLEFKRKAAYPEKLVRELIAFANTDGGSLLIGVDDDGSIPGVKYPDEEAHVVREALTLRCRPALTYHESVIPLSEKKFVVRFDVPPSSKKPHFLVMLGEPKQSFVRVKDMSIKASTEMQEIIRRSRHSKDMKFTFGDQEKQLIQFLDNHGIISLAGYQKLSGLNRFKASRKLILLVLANVLSIAATEKGDLYSIR